MNSLTRCLRYAFGPNRFHLCGPAFNQELLNYLAEQEPDKGLVLLLKQFKTMYPYLQKIAEMNKIEDPFDDRVIEAYWIGNKLLDNVPREEFYRFLKTELQLDKKIGSKKLEALCGKLDQGVRMHHSFHVFNVWRGGDNNKKSPTIIDLDKCRVGWGEVISIDGPFLTVKTKPLVLDKKGRLCLSSEIKKRVRRQLSDDYDFDEIKVGDTISIHWEIPCEILTKKQIKNLEKYTKLSLQLANQTLQLSV